MGDNHFILFSDCVLVKGYLRSSIYDIGRGKIHLIPNELYDILTLHNRKTIHEIEQLYPLEDANVIQEYFSFLEELELIFFCDEEDFELFPPISREFDHPSLITNAIIDTNNTSSHNFQRIFNELNKVRCYHIQLRFFSPVSLQDLVKVLEASQNLDFVSIDLLLPYDKEIHSAILNTKELFIRFPITIIEFHSMNEIQKLENEAIKDKEFHVVVVYSEKVIDSSHHCGVISPKYFATTMQAYNEALSYNSCLNRKISIDVSGEIKNCPSMSNSFGHIDKTDMLEVVNNDTFRSYWNLKKDIINICKVCEYRYACTDCRAYTIDNNLYEKPSKCNYDPFTAVWSSPPLFH